MWRPELDEVTMTCLSVYNKKKYIYVGDLQELLIFKALQEFTSHRVQTVCDGVGLKIHLCEK